MNDDNDLFSLELFAPGDFVRLRYLSYKSPYYDFLVDYQNTDTKGMVLEIYLDNNADMPFYNIAETKLKVLIGEKIVITSAQDWVKA